MDEEGYLINPCREEHLPSSERPLLEAVIQIYREETRGNLHSVWIRGSLPRGLAVAGLSDLDTFALVHSDDWIHWKTPAWKPKRVAELKRSFDWTGDIELVINSCRKPLQIHNRRLAMLIATQSLCLYGENLVYQLPRFKPGPDLVLNARWLEEDVAAFLKNSSTTASDIRGLTKVILRAGFELVMEREAQYTPDLYWCYKAFAKWYPELSRSMYEVLDTFLNPASCDEECLRQIAGVGEWLIAELQCRGVCDK